MTETWSEWREHDGGECPVGPEVVVNMRLRCGISYDTCAGGHLRWGHRDQPGDIMAYRVQLPQFQPAASPSARHTHDGSPKTLDEIKARAADFRGDISHCVGPGGDFGHIRTLVGIALDEAYEAGRRDVNGYVQCRCDALQDALKGARDLLMQAAITSQRIVFDAALGDYILAVGDAPPADPFQPSQQPPAPKPADAYMAHGDKIGVHAPTPAAATTDRKPHGIGRVWRNGGIGEMPR